MRVNLQAKSLYFTTLSNTYKDKLVLSSSTVSRLLFDFKAFDFDLDDYETT